MNCLSDIFIIEKEGASKKEKKKKIINLYELEQLRLTTT